MAAATSRALVSRALRSLLLSSNRRPLSYSTTPVSGPSSLFHSYAAASQTRRSDDLDRLSDVEKERKGEEGFGSNSSSNRTRRRGDATVHPTAVVHPHAILGEEVTVGPFCTIGADTKIGNASQMHPGSHIFGDTEIGEHCIIMPGAVIGAEIPGKTIIGNNNVIGHHAVVGVKCQDKKYKPGDPSFLYVGDNNDIREHVSIHRSSKSDDKTVIGDGNLIMGSCHIAHDCKVGDNNIFANNTLLAGHVIVEDSIHTAGAVAIHQFCHLGSFCFIGGGSVINQDVPMYMMVSGDRAELRGLNFEGLKRHGFLESEIRSMRRAYRKIFMALGPNSECFDDRLAQVEGDTELSSCAAVRSMIKSIRDSFCPDRRGICKFGHWSLHQKRDILQQTQES